MRNIILPAAVFMLFSYSNIATYIPFTVEGVIKDRESGLPIRHVHVFTTKGEEEAVTDEKGAFRFQSWKETVVLTTEREGYRKTQQAIKLPLQKQTILLTKE